MTIISFVPDFEPRDGEQLLDAREPIDWKALRGQSVRIVFEDRGEIRQVLTAAMRHDCAIDLLDVFNIDYCSVHYDTSEHRALKRKLGMPIPPHAFIWYSPLYAAWLLKQYPGHEAGPPVLDEFEERLAA